MLGTLPGRAVVLGVAIKLLLAAVSRVAPVSGALGALDAAASVALLIGIGALAWRLFVAARRRVLWRVRRKLTLSYIFIGFVPALLIIVFFLLCGLLLFFNISSYLVQNRIRVLSEQAQFVAQTTALDVQRSATPAAVADTLARREAALLSGYPGASLALVPASLACPAAMPTSRAGVPPAVLRALLPMTVGPWTHLDPPATLPSWVPCAGFGGLIAYTEAAPAGTTRTRLGLRAVAIPDGASPGFALVLDVPISDALAERVREDTGIELGNVTPLAASDPGLQPAEGRGAPSPSDAGGVAARSSGVPPRAAGGRAQQLGWVTFLTYTDWESGRSGHVAAAIGMSIAEIYDRISASPVARTGNLGFGQILLLLLSIVGGLFLVIQLVALVMGLALARSITGAVHALFTGTERVRQGDFTHKIAVRSRDQLGELAESFNQMTASIEDLLKAKAEKERLEQELQIARQIQMSLLPQGPLLMPGLTVTALCEPAREVGGDYYDFLPIDEARFGLLIADVSGKGTSAALYMAELKGLVLSLSQLHTSPRDLLIDANRIISAHLDNRSFITMTYAVVDVRARTFTYARAGHCPLIYRPGAYAEARGAQILAPSGMVVGLKIDDGTRFGQLLEEQTLALGAGDLIVLFTDGISEAMNEAADCYGEERLGRVIQDCGDLGSTDLRERIVAEIRTFTGAAPQHDDMTMLLLKVEEGQAGIIGPSPGVNPVSAIPDQPWTSS